VSAGLAGVRPEATRAVRRGAARCLRQAGFAALHEMTFPSGRRADIVALGPANDIWIVEVKSCLADFRADAKWVDYADYCDALVFAVSPSFPAELIPEPVGLIIADAYGGELVREPARAALAPARRRALVHAFARMAAQRLGRIEDPDFDG
jgi:hypothetical protein